MGDVITRYHPTIAMLSGGGGESVVPGTANEAAPAPLLN